MRITIFSAYYPPQISSAAVRLKSIAEKAAASDRVESVRVVAWNVRPFARAADPEAPQNAKITVARTEVPAAYKAMRVNDPNPFVYAKWMNLARHEIEERPFDLAYISSPPGVVAGSAEACLDAGVPYALEWRDEWMGQLISEMNSRMPIARAATPLLGYVMRSKIARLVSGAEFVVAEREPIAVVLKSMGAREVLIVRNGVPAGDVREASASAKMSDLYKAVGIDVPENAVKIVYTGDLGVSYYSPQSFIHSYSKLQSSGTSITLTFFSGRPPADARTKDFIKCKNVLLLNVPNKTLLGLLASSDIGLYSMDFSDPQAMTAVGTKVFEYVCTGLPILAITPKGSAIDRLIGELGCGWAVHSHDPSEVEASWLKAVAEHRQVKERQASRKEELLARFDRSAQNEALLKRILDVSVRRS